MSIPSGWRAGESGKIGAVVRRLFVLACATSVVLCLTAASLWVRSEFEFVDEWRLGIVRPFGATYLILDTSPGQMRVGTLTEQEVTQRTEAVERSRRERRLVGQHIGSRGRFSEVRGELLPRFDRFTWSGGPRTGTSGEQVRVRFDTIRLPLWLVTAFLSVAPLGWFRRSIQRRRRRLRLQTGCCPLCGYDLRANRERCSECGAPVPTLSPRARRIAVGLIDGEAGFPRAVNLLSSGLVPRVAGIRGVRRGRGPGGWRSVRKAL
jgi:hypothetical protein